MQVTKCGPCRTEIATTVIPPFENEECVCKGRAVMSCAVCMWSCLVVNLQTLTSTLRLILIVYFGLILTATFLHSESKIPVQSAGRCWIFEWLGVRRHGLGRFRAEHHGAPFYLLQQQVADGRVCRPDELASPLRGPLCNFFGRF